MQNRQRVRFADEPGVEVEVRGPRRPEESRTVEDRKTPAGRAGALGERSEVDVERRERAAQCERRDGMIQHAREFHAAGIPFIFDPGQGLPMFNGEDLMNFINIASYVTVNDYEAQLLQERTGKTLAQIAGQVKALIVTLGAKGSEIYAGGKKFDIPCVKPAAVLDPTGCGDAFRAGMLYGLTNDMDWMTIGRLSSLMGSIKITSQGGQNHVPSREAIEERFKREFGYRLDRKSTRLNSSHRT